MATHLRLIWPKGSLARKHQAQLLCSSNFCSVQLSNGRSATSGSVSSILLARREFSGTIIGHSDRSSSSSSSTSGENNGSKSLAGKDKPQQEALEGDAHRKLAEEAERKRVEAQDAALKEILDSAASEKQKLEDEARKAAEERARQIAAKEVAAREAAAKKEAAEKLAAEKLAQSKSTTAKSIMESSLGSASASSPLKQSTAMPKETTSAAATPKDSISNGQSQEAGASPSFIHPNAATNVEQQASGTKDTSTRAVRGEDPLDPLRAKLLPYKKSLESSTEYIRSALPDRLRQLSESVKRKDYHDTIAQLSEHLNNFTGYNSINDLKHKVITHGDRLDDARIKLAQAKQAYEDAISTRSDTQKAINDLLQRKHLWSPNDVIRFTDLYRSEHANEQAEQMTKTEYKHAESDVESKSRMLTRVIMERYHEEQVWSDKIRAASTYGTWGLVGVNVMAFLIVQAFVEPRRRRKQVERYEELVQDLTERGILPDKAQSVTTSGAAAAAAAGEGTAIGSAPLDQSSGEGSVATTNASQSPVAVGGALLGGEDVLLKMMKSAERQEERLDRMETLLLQQTPRGSSEKKMSEVILQDVHGSSMSNDFVLGEDGEIVFLSEEDGDSALTDMAESWREELAREGKMPRGGASESRLSVILQNGDAEVPARRRDFLVSSLGGALVGGLVAVAVMMNR